MQSKIATVVIVGVSATIAAAAASMTDAPFMLTFVIVLAALLVNGLIATVEDDLPGGFSNPDGTNTPGYVDRVEKTFSVVRWGGAAALWSVAAAMLAVSIGSAARDLLLRSGFAALLVAASLVLIRRRRWALIAVAFAALVLISGVLIDGKT